MATKVTHLNPLVWDKDTKFVQADYNKLKATIDGYRKKYSAIAMGHDDAHRVVFSPAFLRRFIEDSKVLKDNIHEI